jgi:hypothetical protein
MDAGTLTSPARPGHRRSLVTMLARPLRVRVRAPRIGAEAPLLRVDESIHVDPALLDREAWLEWGRENLSAEQFERRRRAVEADRQAAQREALC